MNATGPEANEKPLERRESSGSNGSGSDNPLMKLVDAALAPSNSHDDPTKPTNDSGTDFGKDTVMASEEETETASTPSQDVPVLKGTVQDLVARQDKKLTFAEYLMQCLNDEANHDVLQWMPCGLQFTITNHRKFTMERMPTLFKIRNMSSFVRKLTRWGFNRVHEKETGNSDIFKHPLFQKDQPDLCKKIRCVNRSATTSGPPPKPLFPFMGHGNGGEMMGNMSESSMRHGMHGQDMHMVSPRRSMGMGHNGGPYMVSGTRPQYPPGRYAPPQQTPVGPPAGSHPHHHHPRVSPEYEKEMIQGNSFHPRHPGPPQVYSPPPIGRSMSAAAEYELEQVLLERQRARSSGMYRDPPQNQAQYPPGQHTQSQHPQGQHTQGQHPQSQHPQSHQTQHPQSQHPQGQLQPQHPPPPPQQQHQVQPPQAPRAAPGSPSLLGNGSERSLGSITTTMTADGRAGGRYMESPSNLASATNSVVSAALETLQREGDYEFDMSPREAMLRAVLHKRQQQRAAQQQHPQTRPIMRGAPPPTAQGFSEAGNPPPPPPQGRAPAHPPVYYR